MKFNERLRWCQYHQLVKVQCVATIVFHTRSLYKIQKVFHLPNSVHSCTRGQQIRQLNACLQIESFHVVTNVYI